MTDYNVKLSQPSKYKVSLTTIIAMPVNLNDLADVEISGTNDNYVLMYDEASGKWIDVNPDEVLSAATTEPIQPGLPTDFKNQLDVDLDDRIDLDAGSF